MFLHCIVLRGLPSHIHFLGTSASVPVIQPDNAGAGIINTVEFILVWQPTYLLAEPTVLLFGSSVNGKTVFNNSVYDVSNPDPNVTVIVVLQCWEETFIGYFSYTDLPK